MKSPLNLRSTFFRLPEWSQTFTLAALIGVSTGLAASLLRSLMDRVEDALFFQTLGSPADFSAFPLRPWTLLLLPCLGGLLAGWMVARLEPAAAGGGTEEVVNGFHSGHLRQRWRVTPVKLVASALACGLGIAGGTEGPMCQIGAAIGQRWSELFGLGKGRQRQFYTAGVAGGVGAIFHAPLGGALFAAEIYYRRPDLESSSLLPALLSSSLAFTVYNLGHAWQPLLPAPVNLALGGRDVAMIVALGLGCGLMSRWTLRLVKAFRRLFAGLSRGMKPAAAGLLSGGLVLAVLLASRSLTLDTGQPALVVASLGEGYGVLRLAAGGVFPLASVLLMMLALRLSTTAMAQASESPVGAFAPAMVIGAATGLALGIFASWAGLSQGSPVHFALAGMAAFFAASFRSPLASVVMIAEVSQGYAMLPALMLAAALGYLAGPDPGWVHSQRLARGSRI